MLGHQGYCSNGLFIRAQKAQLRSRAASVAARAGSINCIISSTSPSSKLAFRRLAIFGRITYPVVKGASVKKRCCHLNSARLRGLRDVVGMVCAPAQAGQAVFLVPMKS